jgi:predicted Ser/Thr protein kinase
MIPEKIGRYIIESELGRGGMAVVYLARDPYVERQVAVKVLPRQFTFDPQFRARFQREAQVIATLDHPAIVPVYDFGEHDEQPYIVMRYMKGGSLADKLKVDGPMRVAETARILERIGGALDEAHQKGIVHRDLKPGNILFDDRGDAFVGDFGIVKLSESTVNYTGNAIIGTPGYMSPEQARGDEEIDGRSDIYALGAIVYEMLTGLLPYQADTPVGLMMKHILEPVPDIRTLKPDLPPVTSQVISKAMAKQPNERYQHCADVATALTQISSGMPASALADSDVTMIDSPAAATALPAKPVRAAPVGPTRSAAIPADSAIPSPELEAAAKEGGRKVPIWAWAAGCLAVLVCGGAVLGLGGLGVLSSFLGEATPTQEVALATATSPAAVTDEPPPTEEPEATATLALLPTNTSAPPPLPTLPAVTGSVSVGDRVNSSLSGGQSQTWEIAYSGPDTLDMIITPEGTEFDVVVDVVDGAGNSILRDGPVDESFITERVTGVAVDGGGRYYVVVSGFDSAAAGNYSLWVIPSLLSGTNPGSQIQVTDSIEIGDEEHFFPFEAPSANLYVAAIVESLDEDFDAVLGLYDDDTEALLEEVDLSFTKEYLIIHLPTAGSYYFKVTGYEGATGAYKITLSGQAAITFLLAAGDDVTGVLAQNGRNEYIFNNSAGTSLTIVVRPDAGIDAVIEIFDSNNNLLAGADDTLSGEAEQLTFALPADGRYRIRVRGYSGEAGSYVMTVR